MWRQTFIVVAQVTNHLNGYGYLNLVSDHLGTLDRAHRPVSLLSIAQDTVGMLANNDWTKERIRAFVHENARMPFSKYGKIFIDTNTAKGVPNRVLKTGEKSLVVPSLSSCKKILSKEVKLPANWEQLFGQAKE